MRAKEYLRQIEALNCKINQRILELERLRALISEGAINYSSDKIQSSHTNLQEERLVKYNDMQNEIECMVDELIDLKHEIINQIHKLDAGKNTSIYIHVLFKKYVELKPLKEISKELNYNYKWLCQLHGKALQCFDEQVLKQQD